MLSEGLQGVYVPPLEVRARMSAPPSHYALVGPLWAELEQVLADAGAVGHSADDQINSLRARLGARSTRRLHGVRMQRNRLMHSPPQPLPDPLRWERECRDAIADVRTLCRFHRADPTWREKRHHMPGHVPRHPSHFRSHHVQRRWPLWARAAAWGLGGYVVLTNEALTVMSALAVIGLLVWSIVGKR